MHCYAVSALGGKDMMLVGEVSVSRVGAYVSSVVGRVAASVNNLAGKGGSCVSILGAKGCGACVKSLGEKGGCLLEEFGWERWMLV